MHGTATLDRPTSRGSFALVCSRLDCLAGRSSCPWNRGTVDTVACRQTTRGKRRSQRSRPLHQGCRPWARLGCRVGWWRACGWGSGMPAPSGQIPPPWAWWENEAPAARAACSSAQAGCSVCSRIQRDVVGAAVDDRDGDDAGHLVGVLPLGAVHDLRQEAPAGAQGDSALGRVVDLALPAVDGADGREVVPRSAQPIGHESAGELHQPVRIGGGDDDLADLIGWGRHPAPSTRQPAPGRQPRSGPCCSSR